MSGDTQFLTKDDGSLPDLSNLPATSVGQFAKNAVDSSTRALLVTSPAGKPIPVSLAPPSEAGNASLSGFTKTVASSATPERLFATAGVKLASQIVVYDLKTNTGAAYLGAESPSAAQQILAPFIFGAPDGKKIDAYSIFVGVSVDGEGVRATLID